MPHILDKKLDKETFKYYVIQSVMATLVLYFCLNFPMVDDAVLIAAIGSTTFVIFAMPHSLPARPRNVLGSHFVCGLIGIFFSWVNSSYMPISLTISIAVGFAIFAMVVLDIEHPPAGGTVIFLVFSPDITAFVALLFLASMLNLISYFLKPHLINLM